MPPRGCFVRDESFNRKEEKKDEAGAANIQGYMLCKNGESIEITDSSV